MVILYFVIGGGGSVLNRSKNSESIIGGVSDLIIDFKSIFEPDLSNDNTCNVALMDWKFLSQILWN